MNVRFAIRQNQNRTSELCHYGVKGMKWGVRNEKKIVSNPKPNTSSTVSLSGGGIAKSNKFTEMKKQLDAAIKDSGLKLGSKQKISIDVSDPNNPHYVYQNGNKTLSYLPNQIGALITVASRDRDTQKVENLETAKEKMALIKSQTPGTMIQRHNENIQKAMNSKSVKKTLKQKLSNVANSAKSTIKSGMDAVAKFMKNPLGIQNKTTVTRNTDEIKREIAIAKVSQKKK